MPEHNSKSPPDEAGLGLGFLGLDLAHPPFGMPLPCESNYGRLKIVPSQIGDTTPYQTTEMPNAAFSDREQVDKPASLDGKGRPGCHERPSYLDAWLSCAGSGELAPEVGIFNHN